MASLPYITSPGNISKALQGIKNAAVPERVSQDFVKTILKIPGGSGDQVTTFLKKIGFSDQSGKPTELYTKFRNPSSSGKAIAKAIRSAYGPLFIRNEFANELSEDQLIGLIVEETGQPHDSNPVKMSFSCFKALRDFADFDSSAEPVQDAATQTAPTNAVESSSQAPQTVSSNIGLNLGYTINLNLPASSDPAVFNAIFKSLKEHLLSDKDG